MGVCERVQDGNMSECVCVLFLKRKLLSVVEVMGSIPREYMH